MPSHKRYAIRQRPKIESTIGMPARAGTLQIDDLYAMIRVDSLRLVIEWMRDFKLLNQKMEFERKLKRSKAEATQATAFCLILRYLQCT